MWNDFQPSSVKTKIAGAKGGNIFRAKVETFSCEGKTLNSLGNIGGSLVGAKKLKEEGL